MFKIKNYSTGRNQLLMFGCTNVHLRRQTHPRYFKRAVLDDVMSQNGSQHRALNPRQEQ